MKRSSPHKRQGYLSFLFDFDSFSQVVVFGFSCWFLDFLDFPLPLFLLPGDCEDCTSFTSTKIVEVDELARDELFYLACFIVDGGWIVPTTPYIGLLAVGLVGSVLGKGAGGIKSYKFIY